MANDNSQAPDEFLLEPSGVVLIITSFPDYSDDQNAGGNADGGRPAQSGLFVFGRDHATICVH
jgi:hypothetical protein